MKDMRYPEIVDHFKTALIKAQKDRHKRPVMVQFHGSLECEWFVHELEVAFDAVNRYRALRDMPPVTMREVGMAESYAMGHSDYTSKYAIGLADLALKSG